MSRVFRLSLLPTILGTETGRGMIRGQSTTEIIGWPPRDSLDSICPEEPEQQLRAERLILRAKWQKGRIELSSWYR